MIVKLLTEHNLEFLSLKRGCTGSSASTLVKMPHCQGSFVQSNCQKRFLLTRGLGGALGRGGNTRCGLKERESVDWLVLLFKSASFHSISADSA